MQILNSNYSIKPSNYNRPTPNWVKWSADILLLLSLIAAVLPQLPDEYMRWVLFGTSAAKLVSKFISEHIPEIVQSSSDQ